MLLSTPGKVLNRVLLERMKEAVDPNLRDQQAGFLPTRSPACASLWNSHWSGTPPLYINFIDYEKAFDM